MTQAEVFTVLASFTPRWMRLARRGWIAGLTPDQMKAWLGLPPELWVEAFRQFAEDDPAMARRIAARGREQMA